MQILQKLSNKKGSSLVIVLVAFAVLVIIGISLITVASFGHKTTYHYHKKQQAQYTTRFVMQSVVSSLARPNISERLITKVKSGVTVTGEGDLTGENMGTYKVTVEPPAIIGTYTKELMRVEVIADFQGVGYNLSAYFKEGKGDRMNPMDFVFFSKNSGITKTGGDAAQTVFDGKVYTNTAAVYRNVLFKQKFLTFGSSEFLNNSVIEGDLIIDGAFTPSYPNPVVYKGDLYKKGGTDPSGNPLPDIGFTANVQHHQKKWSTIRYSTDDVAFTISFGKGLFEDLTTTVTIQPVNLMVTLPSGEILNMYTAPPLTNMTYGSGRDRIEYIAGTKTFVLVNGDEINMTTKIYKAVNGETLNFANVAYVTSGVASVFGPPDTSSLPSATLSGTISTGDYNISAVSTVGDVVFDTGDTATGGDVNLYFTNNVSINNNVSIIGEHNVYFHLGGKNLTVLDGKYLGSNTNVEHQLYVEGDGSIMTLGGTARFKGCAYLHNGKFVDNGLSSGIKVEGSITASNIQAYAGNTYTYVDYLKEPAFDATLPNPPYRIPPFIISLEKDWTLVKYDK